MLEANLIVVLNEVLAKVEKKVNIYYLQVKYMSSGAIFVFLTKRPMLDY